MKKSNEYDTIVSVNFKCNNEYGKLKKVLISDWRPEVFFIDPRHEIRMLRFTNGHINFAETLRKKGIKVYDLQCCGATRSELPKWRRGYTWCRDQYITIGDKMLITHKLRSPDTEIARDEAIDFFEIENPDNIISVPETRKRILDGGDVIIHNDTIFVGQGGQASNEIGLQYMKEKFGKEYRIVPIHMQRPYKTTKKPLHLDCVFNILSKDEGIVYPQGIEKQSLDYLDKNFGLLDINDVEYKFLGTNVLGLGNKEVISQQRKELHGVNAKLRKSGFKVTELDFGNTAHYGGAFRCATSILERD